MFDKLKKCHKKIHILACLTAVFVIILSVFVIYKIRNASREYGYIGRAPLTQYTMTISGEGKVTGIPDIAALSLGVQTEKKTIREAQTENTKKMNDILAAVRELGVKPEDLQTENYNIYPKYSYDKDTGVSNIVGYVVSQSARVKARNLDSIGAILAKAGELGANQIGGISFTIDDVEKLRSEARRKAIEAVREKAADLFNTLGIKAGRIVAFDEFPGGGVSPVYAKEFGGFGGPTPPPQIPSGSLDVVMNVNLTFEIK